MNNNMNLKKQDIKIIANPNLDFITLFGYFNSKLEFILPFRHSLPWLDFHVLRSAL